MKMELHATPEEVMRAVEALQNLTREQGIADPDTFGLALALEESASNIVNHALRRDPSRKFRVSIDHTDAEFVVTLRDDGPAYDPTQAPASAPASDEQVGGWGIQLVRRHVDEMLYRREAGHNVLRLKKRLARRSGEK